MNTTIKIIFWLLLPLLISTARAETTPPPNQVMTHENKPGHHACTIASGDVGGVYYPTAGAICRVLKKNYAKAGGQHIHCSVESTLGSDDNLSELTDHAVELGIAHSDSVRKAWEGQPPFPTPLKQLRSVVSLYTETFTLVTLAKSGIKRLEDLKGKRITIGTPNSGAERIALELLTLCKFKPEEYVIKTVDPETTAQVFKKQEIDAYLDVVGHPNETIWNLTSTEKISFIPLTGGCLEPMLVNSRRLVKSVIPGKMYPGVENDTSSFGIKATLMTTAHTSEELIYQVTKAIVEKLYRFKSGHPDQEAPNPKTLFEGLIAPLHLGAFRYYQELRVLEFKNTGQDIMSELPSLIDKNGVTKILKLTENAHVALNAVKVFFDTAQHGEAGIPLTMTTSPTVSGDGSVYWLVHDAL
ncbi:MAG: TAXI family TRAP transporter solute-binding subunit [Magnetococcus sp. YQC-5]